MALCAAVCLRAQRPLLVRGNAPSLGRGALRSREYFYRDGPTLLLRAPSEHLTLPASPRRSSAPSSSGSTLSGLPGRQAPGSNKTGDFLSYQPRSSNASSPTATNASSSPAPPPYPSNDYNFFIILNTFLWLSRDFKSTLFLLALSTTQLHPPT